MQNKGLEVVKESIEDEFEEAELEYQLALKRDWNSGDEAYAMGFKHGLHRALLCVDAAIRFENTEIKKATEGNQ